MTASEIDYVVFITKSSSVDEFSRFRGIESDGVPNACRVFAGTPTFVVMDGYEILNGGKQRALADSIVAIRNQVPTERQVSTEQFTITPHSVQDFGEALIDRLKKCVPGSEIDGSSPANVLVCVHWGDLNEEDGCRLDHELDRCAKEFSFLQFRSYSSLIPEVLNVNAERIVLPRGNFEDWYAALNCGMQYKKNWGRTFDFFNRLKQVSQRKDPQYAMALHEAVVGSELMLEVNGQYKKYFTDDSCDGYILNRAQVLKRLSDADNKFVSESPLRLEGESEYKKLVECMENATAFPSPVDGPSSNVSSKQCASASAWQKHDAEQEHVSDSVGKDAASEKDGTRVSKGALGCEAIIVNSILLILLFVPLIALWCRYAVRSELPIDRSCGTVVARHQTLDAVLQTNLTAKCATSVAARQGLGCAVSKDVRSEVAPTYREPSRRGQTAGAQISRVLAFAFAGFLYLGGCSLVMAFGRRAFKRYERRVCEDEALSVMELSTKETRPEMKRIYQKMLASLERRLVED